MAMVSKRTMQAMPVLDANCKRGQTTQAAAVMHSSQDSEHKAPLVKLSNTSRRVPQSKRASHRRVNTGSHLDAGSESPEFDTIKQELLQTLRTPASLVQIRMWAYDVRFNGLEPSPNFEHEPFEAFGLVPAYFPGISADEPRHMPRTSAIQMIERESDRDNALYRHIALIAERSANSLYSTMWYPPRLITIKRLRKALLCFGEDHPPSYVEIPGSPPLFYGRDVDQNQNAAATIRLDSHREQMNVCLLWLSRIARLARQAASAPRTPRSVRSCDS